MKLFTGKVIAVKNAKTATVAVERVVVHPIYKKRFKRIKKYQVHDENGIAVVGETVAFSAGRPISKLKRWSIVIEGEVTTEPEKKVIKVEKKVVVKAKAKKETKAK